MFFGGENEVVDKEVLCGFWSWFTVYISLYFDPQIQTKSLCLKEDNHTGLKSHFSHEKYFCFHSDMKFCKEPVYALKSVRNWASLCVLLMVAFLLYHDPFLLLWRPQTPAEVSDSAFFAQCSCSDWVSYCRLIFFLANWHWMFQTLVRSL